MTDQENQPPEFQPPGLPSPRQWKLSTLFILVTLVAVAASGYSRGETNGVWIALFSFWFIALGFGCIVFGAAARSIEHFFMLLIGIIMLGAGLFVLMTFTYW